jgi:hypothetical protein
MGVVCGKASKRELRAGHKPHFLDEIGIRATFFGRIRIHETFFRESIAAAADGPYRLLEFINSCTIPEMFRDVAMAVATRLG